MRNCANTIKIAACLFFLFFIGIEQIAAQPQEQEKPLKLGICFGYSFSGFRDETDIPLNRYINSPVFIIDGNIENGNLLYSFNFGFLSGKSNALEIIYNDDFFVYHQREAAFYRLYFENALDYFMWGDQTFPGYLGGALRGDVYFSYLIETIYYNITALASLNLHVTQKWIIDSNNELCFSASIPVFGYALRPPYYGLLYSPFDLEKRIISVHNYWALFGNLKYQYKINSLIYFNSGLGFELSRINFPQPRKDAAFRLNAGIAFAF